MLKISLMMLWFAFFSALLTGVAVKTWSTPALGFKVQDLLNANMLKEMQPHLKFCFYALKSISVPSPPSSAC